MGNTLSFELIDEAFKGSIVAAMPDCVHAAGRRVAIQKGLLVSTGELATASRMQDH